MLFSGVSRHTSTTRSRRGVEAGPDGERSLHPEYNLMPDIEEFAAFADQLDGNREQSEQVVRLALSRVTATERRRRTVLALNAAAAAVDGTFADLDRAVEELRVQNEALLHARVEVEESSAIYRDFFERAPFAYVITNTATHITYANDAACTLFRRPKNALVRKPLACFVPLRERDIFREAVLRSCTTAGVTSWPIGLVPTGASQVVMCRVQVGLVEGRNPGAPPALYWYIAEESDEDLF